MIRFHPQNPRTNCLMVPGFCGWKRIIVFENLLIMSGGNQEEKYIRAQKNPSFFKDAFSLPRHRARVGPTLATGIPNCRLISV